jgi:chromosome segregation ATPase
MDARQARIAKLEADLATARSDARSASDQSDEWADTLEAALAQANQERDALSTEISTLRRDKQLAEESLAQMRARPSQDGQVEAQMAHIAELEADLAAARSESSAASHRGGETTQLEASLAKAAKEKETLSAEIAKLREDRIRAEEARDQIRIELLTSRSDLKADLAAAEAEVRMAKQMVGETTKLEAALAKATLERDTLSAQIATLRQDNQRAEESLARMRAKPSLDGQVETQKAQIAKLETDLAAARSEVRAAKDQ